MRLLLDTCLSLWAAGTPDRLSIEARALIGNPAAEPLFSAVSVLEVATRNGLGRADFNVDPR